jgi:phenylalanyl-tRNA synthetase beta chain
MEVARIGKAGTHSLQTFDIRQDVWYAELHWGVMADMSAGKRLKFQEIPRFPAVTRDLAFVVDRHLPYEQIRSATESLRIKKLTSFRLFDIFESDKLGAGLKSMAMSFTFQDQEKTLTDQEVEDMIRKIIHTLEKDLGAKVRS